MAALIKTSRSTCLLIFVLLIFLPGCAAKFPSSLPLPEGEKERVMNRFREFQKRPRPQALDADVTLEWEMYGKVEKIPGMLQLQEPSFLRYALVDPLGRQMLILVSDGAGFILVNNRKAMALTGSVKSDYWEKYIPGFIDSGEYVSWLTGRPGSEGYMVREVRRDEETVGDMWLLTGWKDGVRHHLLFNPESGTLKQRIVEGSDNEILLDVEYSGYNSDNSNSSQPSLIKVGGEKVSGSLIVHIEKIISEEAIPPDVFQLSLPEHFTVTVAE